MTDYTNTFGGAAQDAASATILGAEWDTEYENIATAVATKQDKIAAPTDGNLIELDGSGVPTDAGVASGSLTGLTGVVETRVDALETQLPFITPDGAISGWTRSGRFYFPNGDASLSNYSVPGSADGAWWSIGSTSGVADGIWSTLDPFTITYEPKALLLGVTISNTASSTFNSSMDLYMAAGDVTPASPGSGAIKFFRQAWKPDTTGHRLLQMLVGWVPISSDANGPQFQVYYSDGTFGTESITFTLLGVAGDTASA